MSADYAGFCIRVRRSSDSTEQNIGFVGNMVNIAALRTFVGAGDGFVVTKYDQSGNAFNSTQATAASQPRIVSAGVLDVQNAKATSIYSGGQSLVTAAALSHPAQLSFCAVTFANTSANNGVFQLGGTNTLGSLLLETANWSARAFGGAAASRTPYIDSSLEQLTGLIQNLSQVIYRRGVIGGVTSNFTLASASNAILTMGNLNTALPLSGGISELVFFSSTLSTADQQLLERDQGTYYGITVA